MSNSEQPPAQAQTSQSKVSAFLLSFGLCLVLGSIAYAFMNTESKSETSKTEQSKREAGAKSSKANTAKERRPFQSKLPSFPVDAESIALKKRLRQSRGDVAMTEVPLELALNKLLEALDVNLFIAQSARDLIREESLELTLDLRNVCTYSALQHIRVQFPELVFLFKKGVFQVITHDSHQPPMKLGFYDISVLLKSIEKAESIEEKAEKKVAAKGALKQSNSKEDDDSNGCGALEPIMEMFEVILSYDETGEDHRLTRQDSMLVARASEREHKMIQQFIAAFKENAHSSKANLLNNFNGQSLAHQRNKEWGQKTATALEKTCPSVTFNDTDFTGIVAYIRDKTQLNITIAKSIDAAKIKLSMQFKNRSFKDILDWVLKENRLALIPFHEAFRIVAIDNGEQKQFQLKIYSIEDILYPKGEKNPKLSGELLIDLIREATDEGEWQDPASIHLCGGQMLIYQSEEILNSVDKSLAAIRAEMTRKK